MAATCHVKKLTVVSHAKDPSYAIPWTLQYPSKPLITSASASIQALPCSRHSHNGLAIQSCAPRFCLCTITVGWLQLHLRPANPILRRRSPGTRLRQMLAQLPETSRLSCRASCRQGTGECRCRLAFSVVIREERGGRSSHRLGLDRRSSGGRIVAGSAWGASESVKTICGDADDL